MGMDRPGREVVGGGGGEGLSPAPGVGAGRVALCDVLAGGVGVVLETAVGEQDGAMLRAMGLVPGATVRVCRAGEPCIVAVLHTGASACACGGSRIGLARRLARGVYVRPRGGAGDGPAC